MHAVDDKGAQHRERMIASALADIGAEVNGDPIKAADALIRWSVRLLDVSGAGVMLADNRGTLRSMIVSSDLVRTLETAELRYGRGPCVESHRHKRAVIHADLHVTDDRWPEFAVLARAGGVRAAHAIPVVDNGKAIGVLNLFRTTVGGLSDPDAALALAFAETAAGAIHQRSSSGPQVSSGVLTAAVAEAATVQRAVGMLAARLQLDIETAHAVLNWVAQDRGTGLGKLADDLIAGATTIALPLSIAPPPPDVAGPE